MDRKYSSCIVSLQDGSTKHVIFMVKELFEVYS